MTTTIDEQATEIRATAIDKWEKIRQDIRLSHHAKLERISKEWLTMKEALEALEANTASRAKTRASELERRLYGLRPGFDASATISYRDALDRASAVNTERAGIDLLDRATTLGDTVLAKALLAVAFDKQWVDVINYYADKNPTAMKDIQELWSARDGGNDYSMFAFSVSTPPELRNINESVIRQYAAAV